MKKRLLASLMVVMLTAGMMPSVQAIDNFDSKGYKFALAPFSGGTYFNSMGMEVEYHAGTSLGACRKVASFSELYKMFADPAANSTISKYYDSADEATRTCIFNKTSSFAMMIANTENTSHTLEEELKVADRYAQIGTYNVFDTVTLNLEGGLSVENGGLLLQNTFNGSVSGTQTDRQKIVVQLGAPAEIGAEGRLILDGTDNVAPGHVSSPASELIAPEGQSAIVVKDGGQAEIANFEVKRSAGDSSEAALIDVENGGELIFFASGMMDFDEETGMPEYVEGYENPDVNVDLDNGASSSPAVSVANGATVTVEAGDFSSENGTIFDLADGATLNLEGGTISNTGDKPAIHADSGATVILPENPDAIQITTSNENGQAIDLAGGSKVQKGDQNIVVGDGEGEGYVDNNGVIHLPSQSTVDGDTLENGGTVDPDGNVEENTVSVTGVELNKSTLSLDEGDTYTLTATVAPADAANKAVTWTSSNSGVATVDSNGKVTAVSSGTATITVTTVDGGKTATCAVTVSHTSSGGGSSDDDSDPTYSVTLPKNVKGGEIKTSHRYAEQGDTVTITVDPDKGYELDELTVTDSKGKELDLTDKGNGKYTFKMPGTRVEVEVSFKLVETEPEAPAFADVPASAYYADAVKWAVEQGITSGTSATTFSPDMSCTRAQIVTFLWRANGAPKADGANPFTDVSADAYYYDAVLWAVKEGITSGTSATTFSPDATVTRAQTVTFLYRAAGAPAVTGGSFADVAADAYYAGAVAWAVKEGVTSGTGGNNFSPDAPCTRGQIVTFMYRGVQ